MTLNQISVFLENVSGRLADVTKVLSEGDINLRAITIADTADFGILRIVADKPEETLALLEKHGFAAKVTKVLAVEIEDKPGALARVMDIFSKNNIDIEYLYASLEKNQDNAVVVLKVENVEHGQKIVEEHGLISLSEF